MHRFLTPTNRLASRLIGFGLLLSSSLAVAQPAIVTTVPPNLTGNVSPSAPVSFTFSEAMNPVLTTAQFMDTTTVQFLTVTPVWSSGNKVLTCTPVAPWPANRTIVWMVSGENPAGTALGGTPSGIFMTAAASTGCDPGATMPSFTVSKGWMYEQTSTVAPGLNANNPYCFLACMTLPCPRNATNVTVAVPGGPTLNLMLSTLPGHLTLPDCSYTDLTAYEAAYPYGNYPFTIQATTSNQQVTVNFPSGLTQPPAPRIANYAAAQMIDAAQPFTLAWDPLANGTTADCIYAEIYGGVFSTPGPGGAGALNGTATGVLIPAGTLQPNHSYSGCVTFYHLQLVTNGTSHVSLAYRASTTEFGLRTGSGQVPRPVITNSACALGGALGFEIVCSPGQMLVVETSTNLLPQSWQTLCTTNTTTSRARIVDPQPATNQRLFYRVRVGP